MTYATPCEMCGYVYQACNRDDCLRLEQFWTREEREADVRSLMWSLAFSREEAESVVDQVDANSGLSL